MIPSRAWPAGCPPACTFPSRRPTAGAAATGLRNTTGPRSGSSPPGRRQRGPVCLPQRPAQRRGQVSDPDRDDPRPASPAGHPTGTAAGLPGRLGAPQTARSARAWPAGGLARRRSPRSPRRSCSGRSVSGGIWFPPRRALRKSCGSVRSRSSISGCSRSRRGTRRPPRQAADRDGVLECLHGCLLCQVPSRRAAAVGSWAGRMTRPGICCLSVRTLPVVSARRRRLPTPGTWRRSSSSAP